jgi:2-iminobutanoate/2-iminopropanoate deaminase
MTNVTPVHLEGHSKPIGRYSPATVATIDGPARLLCISGQVATDASGTVLGPGNPREQAEIVFGRLASLLEAAGGTVRDLLSVTIFLADRAHFEAINQVRNHVFRDHAPASTLVIAQLMEPGCLIEVNGLALIRAGSEGGG